MSKSLSILFFAHLLFGHATAHTWIDYLVGINDGEFVGTVGYPRAYVGRGDAGFTGFSNMWLLPQPQSGRLRINGSDFLCHTDQRTAIQNGNYPRLKAAPGSFIAMKYTENGHVTLPTNQLGKPEKGGTVFVYGTSAPKNNEKIMDVLQWNSEGSGGDKRGVLISAQNYDDGRCYEINDKAISVARQKEFPNPNPGQPSSRMPQYCETDVQIPKNVTTGKPYTIYWVWQWPTLPNVDPNIKDGKDEYYISCMDVDLVSSSKAGKAGKAAVVAAADANKQQLPDPQPSAVKNYQSRTALVTNVMALASTTTKASATRTGKAKSSHRQTSVATTTKRAGGGVDSIPTLSALPNGRPQKISQPAAGSASSTANSGGQNIITVTVTDKAIAKVTVTEATYTTMTVTLNRDSAKFRARYLDA